MLNGGDGADTIYGGDGIDTLDLSGATNFQTINLVTNVNVGGYGHKDTFIEVENVIGSATHGDKITGSRGDNELYGLGANDVLRGFNGDDALYGGIGNDLLSGGRGADRLDGGEGEDWVIYIDSTVGVTIDLAAGTAMGGVVADGDTLFNIERVRGSFYNDKITGDDEGSRILGDRGNDTIKGGDGFNILSGGDGKDIINGGGARDNISGGNNKDWINGGGGTDSLLGNAGNDIFVFEAGNALDNILDFDDAGNDQIDFSSFGFTDYSQIESVMRQTGDHVKIDLGGLDILLLRHTDIATISEQDFIF